MIGASLYILLCSAKNRTRQRLRRLREPRYLFGAIAGVAYLVFTLAIRMRTYGNDRPRRRNVGRLAAPASLFGFPGLPVGSVLLAGAALVSWLMPFSSSLLEFTRAETNLLFPAPVTRAQLVLYRLLRSQTAVLTGALIMALAYPTGSFGARFRGLLAAWMLLMGSHLFFTIVTLARSSSSTSGRRRLFAWPAAIVPAAAIGTVLWAVFDSARRSPLQSSGEVVTVVVEAARNGGARLLLWPFAALVRPLFADGWADFFVAAATALGVYGLLVCWLIWVDAMSAEAAEAAVERQVNGPPRRRRTYVARPVTWRLAAAGRAEPALVWKGALQTFRTVNRPLILRVLLIAIWMVIVSLFMSRTRGVVAIVGVFAAWGALFTLFMGPQMIRMDLREDLAHLELIKTWPIGGETLIRGEILWPAAVVTMVTWLFGVTAMVLSLVSGSLVPAVNRAAVWLALLLLVPGVVLAQYTMHNAVALLFPGWVPMGRSRARGVDAVGQRLIVLAANWLGLIVALAPAIAATALIAWSLRPAIGAMVLPIGASIATAVVLAETWFVTRALAPVYERLDITSVERPD